MSASLGLDAACPSSTPSGNLAGPNGGCVWPCSNSARSTSCELGPCAKLVAAKIDIIPAPISATKRLKRFFTKTSRASRALSFCPPNFTRQGSYSSRCAFLGRLRWEQTISGDGGRRYLCQRSRHGRHCFTRQAFSYLRRRAWFL